MEDLAAVRYLCGFDVYAVAVRKKGRVRFVDALYDQRQLAETHRIGLLSLEQYRQADIQIEIEIFHVLASLDQVTKRFDLKEDVIAQTPDLFPHAWIRLFGR